MAGQRSKARAASTRKAKAKATTHPYMRNASSTKKPSKSTEVLASETSASTDVPAPEASASTAVPALDAFASTVISAGLSLSVISASSSLSVSGFILQEPELRARQLTSNLERHETAKLRCKGEITCYTDMPYGFGSRPKRMMLRALPPLFLSSNEETGYHTQYEQLITAVLQSGTATRAARGDNASHARLVLWKIWFHSRLRWMKHGMPDEEQLEEDRRQGNVVDWVVFYDDPIDMSDRGVKGRDFSHFDFTAGDSSHPGVTAAGTAAGDEEEEMEYEEEEGDEVEDEDNEQVEIYQEHQDPHVNAWGTPVNAVKS